MKKLALSFSIRKFDNIIILLFSLLPLIDSINGFLVRQGSFSIGSMYKVCFCAFLAVPLLLAQKIRLKTIIAVLSATAYIAFSVIINRFALHAESFKMDYVIKLLFNIGMFALLLENYSQGILTRMSFYRMLNFSAWLLPVCYFVPLIFGLGYNVYSGGMGYKAFFFAQNELSLIIIVLFFFSLYKLSLRTHAKTIIQVSLLLLCGLLLNTKSTIFACLFGVVVYFIYQLKKMPIKVRPIALGVTAVLAVLFLGVTVTVFEAMIGRFTSLMNKYYNGSLLTSILSGRNYMLSDAWDALIHENFWFRIFFGNGFFSEYLVEMDVIDIFFYLGIFGAVAAVFFLVYVFKKSYANMKTDPTCIRLVSFIMVMFFLNITGHVLFMAMSGCYFVVYLLFIMTFPTPDKEQLPEW